MGNWHSSPGGWWLLGQVAQECVEQEDDPGGGSILKIRGSFWGTPGSGEGGGRMDFPKSQVFIIGPKLFLPRTFLYKAGYYGS